MFPEGSKGYSVELAVALVGLGYGLPIQNMVLVNGRPDHQSDAGERSTGLDEHSSGLIVPHAGCAGLDSLPPRLRDGDGIGIGVGHERAELREGLEVLRGCGEFVRVDVVTGGLIDQLVNSHVEVWLEVGVQGKYLSLEVSLITRRVSSAIIRSDDSSERRPRRPAKAFDKPGLPAAIRP